MIEYTEEEKQAFKKAGKDGGDFIKEKYGKNHYKKMAEKRWSIYKNEKSEKD